MKKNHLLLRQKKACQPIKGEVTKLALRRLQTLAAKGHN
jgi:hypothetical protein